MFGKNKTQQQIREDNFVRTALKIKEATRLKFLIPIDNNEARADHRLFDEEVQEEHHPISIDEDDYISLSYEESLKLAEEKAQQKNLKLAKHLEKYSNPFPLEVFPEPIKKHILDSERCLNFPQEFYACGILSAAAGAIRNNFQLVLKNEMVSTPMLYMMVVGKAGANKSAPLTRALKPLMEQEVKFYNDFNKQYSEYLETPDSTEPVSRQLVVNDITMEALKDVLAENPQGVTLYYDEFRAFLNSMNKYRGGGDDMETWLSIWSGKFMKIKRKGKKAVLVRLPFVNCIGTIQTDVILKYIASHKEQNGFIDRLLFGMLDKKPKMRWNSIELNESLSKQYDEIIRRILNVETKFSLSGDIDPHVLKFAPEAHKKMLSWQNSNADDCEHENDQQIVGLLRKMEIYVLRFVIIIAVLDYAHRAPILLKSTAKIVVTSTHVESAIKLTEYFKISGKNLLDLVPPKISTKQFDPRLIAFHEKLDEFFSTKDALRVGRTLSLKERTVFNYLKTTDLFKSIAHGQYQKCHQQK